MFIELDGMVQFVYHTGGNAGAGLDLLQEGPGIAALGSIKPASRHRSFAISREDFSTAALRTVGSRAAMASAWFLL